MELLPERFDYKKPRSSSVESNSSKKSDKEDNAKYTMDTFEDIDLRDAEKAKKKSKKEKESKDGKKPSLAKGTFRKLGKTISSMKRPKTKFNSIAKASDIMSEQMSEFWCSKEYVPKEWKENVVNFGFIEKSLYSFIIFSLGFG